MRKMFLIVLPLFLTVLQAQQLVDGIQAIVGREIILRSEVQQYVQNYIVQNRIDVKQNPELLTSLTQQTMEKLIEQKLLLAKAIDDTLTVDDMMLDQKVEERMRYLISQVGSEDKLEAVFGSPIKKIKKDTRRNINEQMLVEQARAAKFRGMKISRREVEAFYKTYQDSLPVLKETVDISHILMLVKPSEEALDQAYNRILEVSKKIESGADFAKLAEKFSEDPASAVRGGDLGLISRGDFVPEFESAAYKLKDDEISDIVQTQFGYHIIKMIERRGEKIHTRHILIRVTPTEDDETRIQEQLSEIKKHVLDGEDFGTLALKHSDDDNVAKDKGHLGIFELEQMVIPQFKTIVQDMKSGEISDPFKTDFGYHIVKVNERQNERNFTIEQDWERIEQMALNRKMEKNYIDWIEELRNTVPIKIHENQ